MTTTEELAAIRRSILIQPDEDLHRLAFADRLDERGEEGDAEWAEFIRVQVQLAALGREAVELLNDDTDWRTCTSGSAAWCPNCGNCCCPRDSLGDYPRRNFHLCPLHAPTSPHACHERLQLRIEALRDRETELLMDWRQLMRSMCPEWSWGRGGNNQFDACHGPSARLYFSAKLSRGFIGAITIGFTNLINHSPLIFPTHPIKKVMVDGAQPHDNQGNPFTRVDWEWVIAGMKTLVWPIQFIYDNDALEEPIQFQYQHYNIPLEIGEFIPPTEGREESNHRFYATLDEAYAAVSEGCVGYGRSRAGLPLLGPDQQMAKGVK